MTERAAGSAIVDAAADAARARAARDAEQLGMFGDLPPGLDPSNEFHRGAIEGVKRQPGRPAGAENRATRDVKALINRLLGDPLLELANYARHTPESLARVLGCSKLEAFDRLMAIHRELAPFMHARLAPVDGQGNAVVPTFQMSIGGAPQAGAGAGKPWDYLDLVATENPAKSTQGDDVSHDDVSHGEPK